MEQGQVWEAYASAEPYWAVLTQDRFLKSQMTAEHRAAFFDSGRQHVASLLGTLKRHFEVNFPPRRVIDYGSGAGRLAIPFAELGAMIAGHKLPAGYLGAIRQAIDQPRSPSDRVV